MMQTNEEMVVAIRNGSEEAKAMLCDQCRGLVYLIAKRFTGIYEIEDARQEGYVGLLEAAYSYDPEKGAFATWAVICMKARLYRDSSGLVHIPEGMKTKVVQYRKFVDDYQKEFGRQPTDDELMDELLVTLHELETIRDAVNATIITSLQTPMGEDDDLTLQDTIIGPQDVENAMVEDVYQEALKNAIWAEVDTLPAAQTAAIKGEFLEGKTITEMKMNNPNVRYDKSKAFRELRKRKSLYPYYEDLRSEALKRTGAEHFKRTWTSSTEYAAFKDLGY